MIRRLALAALLALAPSLALAESADSPRAVIAATAPSTANDNRIATTAWVNSFFASGLPLANGKIFIGSAGGIATAQSLSSDCTLVASGVITCTKTNNVVFGALATVTAGTGVATALAVNVGTAGSPVVNGGALGTPSSGTLTNATGLPTTGLTGTLQAAQEPAHTGGVTNSAGSLALTVITNANLTGDTTSVGNATTTTKINGVDQTTAWTTYTPGTTCGAGAGTWTVNTAHSKQMGKTVFWEVDVTLTAVGTCTGQNWKFNLPSTPTTGGGGAGGEVAVNGAMTVCSYSGASAVATCATNGLTLASSQRFVASGAYEGP